MGVRGIALGAARSFLRHGGGAGGGRGVRRLVAPAFAARAEESYVPMLDTGGHMAIITRIAFTPDGRQLVSTSFDKTIRGPITDISEGGVSFLTGDRDIALLIGTPLAAIRLIHEGRLIREVRGEIRNIVKSDESEGGRIRYGVQFGIGRQSIQATEMAVFDPAAETPRTRDTEKFREGPRRHSDLSELARRPPRVLHMETARGEEIVGLLNTSLPLDRDPVPVIIIPPAFGKTKETLFALAQTIVENFYTRGKPVAVIRYDGVRRKGESHKQGHRQDFTEVEITSIPAA